MKPGGALIGRPPRELRDMRRIYLRGSYATCAGYIYLEGMWNFKFHGELWLRPACLLIPSPPERPQVVFFRPSRRAPMLRRPFCDLGHLPLTKIKEPLCAVGYSVTSKPCRLAYPPSANTCSVSKIFSQSQPFEIDIVGLSELPEPYPPGPRAVTASWMPKGSRRRM